jgi:O-antigen ligase
MNVRALIQSISDRPAWRERTRFERGAVVMLVLFAFFCPISIGAAQTSAALALVMLLFSRPWKRRVNALAPVLLPLGLFILLTLLAVLFSTNTLESSWNARNLLIFVIVPVTAYIVRWGDDARALVTALCLGGMVTMVWGVVAILLGQGGGESHLRLTGTLGHYMTAGGELMIISLLAGAVALFTVQGGSRRLVLAATGLLLVGLALTQTRNAYLGFAAGLIILLLLWRRGIVFLLPFVLSLAVLVSPPIIRDRIFQIADMGDASVRSRFAMMETGGRMVADYPLFGVGLQQVQRLYDRYKPEDDPGGVPHLHNNFFQIAAERGLPALIVWMLLIAALAVNHVRLFRRARPASFLKGTSAGGLAAVIALLIAGLFEYNFGDSEVLMLFLLVVSIPIGLAGRGQVQEAK